MKITREAASKEIDVAIQRFKIKDYRKTANWLNFIKKNIEDQNPSDIKQDIQDVFSGYTSDVKMKGGHVETCSILIQNIYARVLQQGVEIFRDTLEETHPFIVRWRITQSNMANMTEFTRDPTISEKARYYLYCFGYLIAVEGSYSNWIRILYRLVCQSFGIEDDSKKIEEWKPYKVQDKLIDINPGYAVLFEGYHRGNLRNAIGHGDFSYDDASKLMHFKHVYQGEIKYDEKLSFTEFYKIMEKIFTVTDTGIEIIFLLRLTSYKHFFPL